MKNGRVIHTHIDYIVQSKKLNETVSQRFSTFNEANNFLKKLKGAPDYDTYHVYKVETLVVEKVTGINKEE